MIVVKIEENIDNNNVLNLKTKDEIGIKDIDEYMYFNAKRYGELEELK